MVKTKISPEEFLRLDPGIQEGILAALEREAEASHEAAAPSSGVRRKTSLEARLRAMGGR